MAQQPTLAHPATMEVQLEASNTPEDAPIPSPIIKTPRLMIRPMHPKDASSMALNANSSVVTKYMSLAFGYPYTLNHAETWIAQNISHPHPTNFGICEASSPDVLIGGIGLKPGGDVNSHTAEIGFWIGEKYWSKGYTTEALEGFTNWVFRSWVGKDSLKFERIWGSVFSGNGASMRCFENCGYAKEGVMKAHAKKHGEIMDVHLFGLTKVDWERRK